MRFEFEYISEDGKCKIDQKEGSLTNAQEKSLCDDITGRLNSLIVQSEGIFCPEKPIKGLPEGVIFKYTFIQPPRDLRAKILKMSWQDEEEIPNPPPRETLSEPNVSEDTTDTHETLQTTPSFEEKNDWAIQYINALNSRLSSMSSTDSAEKSGLDYSISELKQLLTNDNPDNTLFLFSAYLHSSVTHFWEIDRDKAALFSLAARSIKLDVPKSQNSDDGLDKSRGIFARFFQIFQGAKDKV